MSGTQRLVSSELFETFREAQVRAYDFLEEMRTAP